MATEVEELRAQVQELAKRLTVVEDEAAIRRLHYIYGYYIDKCLYNEAIELFEEDCAVHFHGGIYKGKEGVSRLYQTWFGKLFVGGRNGPAHGLLLDHMMLQEVITISPDGKSAKERARALMQGGLHESVAKTKTYPADTAPGDTIPDPFWESGVYENTYSKGSDGKWKIKVLNYRPVWQCSYDQGWGRAPFHAFPPYQKLYPEDPRGPDILVNDKNGQWFWPDTHVIPFHYPHPFTGKWADEGDLNAPKVH
ncbi:hypothetical protein BT69DRAFT_1348549 [Atractiella rhizophila]|nr:hypothetical protein BT69DRAFT_1348549 [Atractiella rhizophila]